MRDSITPIKKRQRIAKEVLASSKNQIFYARKYGVSRETIRLWLNTFHTPEEIELWRQKKHQKSLANSKRYVKMKYKRDREEILRKASIKFKKRYKKDKKFRQRELDRCKRDYHTRKKFDKKCIAKNRQKVKEYYWRVIRPKKKIKKNMNLKAWQKKLLATAKK